MSMIRIYPPYEFANQEVFEIHGVRDDDARAWHEYLTERGLRTDLVITKEITLTSDELRKMKEAE